MGSITMKLALQRVKEKNGTVSWDEASGQYVAEYPVGNGNTYRLWLEENRSMAQKLKYVMDSGIAGTACWAYGQNTEEVLEVFAQVYKHGVDPLSITGAW